MAIGFLLGFVCALCVVTLVYLCALSLAGPRQPVMVPVFHLVQMERVEDGGDDDDGDEDWDEPGGERLPWEGDAEAWRKP